MREVVEKAFDAWIRDKFPSKNDIQSFLLNHESKQSAIDETCRQLKNLITRKVYLSEDYISKFISAASNTFALLAFNKKERELKPHLVDPTPEGEIKDEFKEHIFDPTDEADVKRYTKEVKKQETPTIYVPESFSGKKESN
jgi:hypothetical protein